ncbi:MAG: ATPase [Agathobacter sp.]|uniref:ATPase n=1 Tax=Agathobacter sp. TaxID=2021311 RepID=UPI002E79EB2A|nr:ATPase [Agathobacter sp.]MEE1217261.1 ATPase [Agathobacter sp.]
MSSKMEQIIEEIEDYIDGCKPSPISRNKILVNREQLEELLSELRTKTPEEVKRYQKIISNKEAILADAQAKADQIIAQAQIQTNELVSEHQIMQQAYEQANEVVSIATKQAQEILDNATNEANNLRMSAMAYTDSQLKSIEDILTGSIEASKTNYESLINSLQHFEDVVASNRAELFPPEEDKATEPEAEVNEPLTQETYETQEAEENTDSDIEITNISGSDSDEDTK